MALHKKAIDMVWDEITDDELGEVCTVRARYGEVVFRAIEAAQQGVQLTGGDSTVKRALSQPKENPFIERDSTPPTSN